MQHYFKDNNSFFHSVFEAVWVIILQLKDQYQSLSMKNIFLILRAQVMLIKKSESVAIQADSFKSLNNRIRANI